MNTVVIILAIFLIISLGVIVYLVINQQKKTDEIDLNSNLRSQIKESIEEIYLKKEENFKKTSKENIEGIIDPFKKRIKEFEDEVRNNTEQQNKFHAQTKENIDNLLKQTNQMSSEANKLTKALSGESKTQGNYGELKLKMLLENSGLQENNHYKLQKSFNVKTDDHISREIPDAVIYLPENRHLVIDSKFSFSSYNNYCNSEDDDERDNHGKELAKNLRNRIDDLSSTKYSEIEELNSPDMIFMFIGIDDSLSVALKYDEGLTSYADKKSIALVSPSILHISIKLVEHLWRVDNQTENFTKIYDQARDLVKKFGGFAEDMNSLGNSIATTQRKFDAAKGKLIDGRGSVSSRINKLVDLGSKEHEIIEND